MKIDDLKNIDKVIILLFVCFVISIFLPFRELDWYHEIKHERGYTFFFTYLTIISLFFSILLTFIERKNKWVAMTILPVVVYFLYKTRYEVHHNTWRVPMDARAPSLTAYGTPIFITIAAILIAVIIYKSIRYK